MEVMGKGFVKKWMGIMLGSNRRERIVTAVYLSAMLVMFCLIVWCCSKV